MGVDNRSRAQWREAHERAMDELGFVQRQARRATARLAAVREYVDDPGNWSALDGRRIVLLDLIDADEHDPATNSACAFAPRARCGMSGCIACSNPPTGLVHDGGWRKPVCGHPHAPLPRQGLHRLPHHPPTRGEPR